MKKWPTQPNKNLIPTYTKNIYIKKNRGKQNKSLIPTNIINIYIEKIKNRTQPNK